ncbi:MAG: hypothetical protein DHS20C10_08300 [marine bacterium B5-7]|nr:MAG: hypothetical protein DHS20C10_08300 [marine bacterium B5-7]
MLDCNDAVNGVISQLEKAHENEWHAKYNQEIQREISTAEQGLAKEYAPKIREAEKEDDGKEIEAMRNGRAYFHRLSSGLEDKLRTAKTEACNKIKKKWSDKFNNHFKVLDEKVRALSKEMALQVCLLDLLNKYSWISDQVTTDLQCAFMQEYIRFHLDRWAEKNPSGSLKDWESEDIEALAKCIPRSTRPIEPMPKKDIETIIRSAPISLFSQAIRDPGVLGALFPLEQLSQKASTDAVLNASYSFGDMLRYVNKQWADHAKQASLFYPIIELHQHVKATVMPSSDLAALSNSAWDSLRFVMVDVRGLWLALHKDAKDQWTFYRPNTDEGEMSGVMPAIDALKKACPALQEAAIQSILLEENQCLNDMKSMHKAAIWHAVLLGRIVPALSGSKDINTFRRYVPAPVLAEEARRACFAPELRSGDSGYVYGAKRQEQKESPLLQRTFLWRAPFDVERSMPIDLSEDFSLGACSTQLVRLFDDNKIHYMPKVHELAVHPHQDIIYPQLKPTAAHMALFASLALVNYFSLKTLHLHCEAVNSRRALPKEPLYQTLINFLLENNASLYSVVFHDHYPQPMYFKTIQTMRHCTARNRLIAVKDAADSDTDIHGVCNARKGDRLWSVAGARIYRLFVTEVAAMNDAAVDQLIAQNAAWLKGLDRKEKPAGITELHWSLLQVAQMGLQGVKAFSQQLRARLILPLNISATAKYALPAPDINALFDLNGAEGDLTNDYINSLTDVLGPSSASEPNPLKLFQSLRCVFPNQYYQKAENQRALSGFLRTLSNGYRADAKLERVNFYGLPVTSQSAKPFLESLETLANDRSKPLCIQVCIPEWDAMVAKQSGLQRDNIKRYMAVQNKIVDNQRVFQHEKIPKQREMLDKYVRDELPPVLALQDATWHQPQPMSDEDTQYRFNGASGTLSTQQELQQEVSQQQQQQQQQQEQEQEEQEQELQTALYLGSLDDLVTRNNIQARYAEHFSQSPDVLQHSGVESTENLSDLFGCWAGSPVDQVHTITRIEPAAIQRMSSDLSLFRMGFSLENLPPGFRLYRTGRSNDRGYILGYDEDKERSDLRNRLALSADKRLPFTVVMHEPMQALAYAGDYQQFKKIGFAGEAAVQAWQYLTVEGQLTLAKQRTYHGDEEEVFFHENPSNFLTDTFFPWVQKACVGFQQAWFNILFKTEADLKAFGQLLNRYQPEKGQNRGAETFLTLAAEIATTFGEPALLTWKSSVLSCSKNWSEFLEKDELDAMTRSMAVLKSLPKKYANAWWAMLDKYAGHQNHVLYQESWYAYEKLLNYFKKDGANLYFDEAVLKRYLDKTPDFNANIFLEHLHKVLKKFGKTIDREVTRQRVLDNLDQIDWRHGGLYYAAQYQGSVGWDPALDYNFLAKIKVSNDSGYVPKWPLTSSRNSDQQKLDMLRFANLRLHLDAETFDLFRRQLDLMHAPLQALGSENEYQVRCALLAVLACGVDRAQEVANFFTAECIEQFKDIPSATVMSFNRAINLDTELKPGTLTVRFAQLPMILQAMDSAGTDVNQAVSTNNVRTKQIFFSACGRAADCFTQQSKSNSTLSELLGWLGTQESILAPQLTLYPWLWSGPNQIVNISIGDSGIEATRLQSQLMSVAPLSSTYFPDVNKLTSVLSIPRLDAKARQGFITEMVAKGCDIKAQFAAYRVLETREIEVAHGVFVRRVADSFRDENAAVFKRLLNRVVIPIASSAEDALRPFIQTLSLIDNKAYFNDLGPVLGVILDHALTNGKSRYYTVSHLNEWLAHLKGCLGEDTNKHYPAHLLNELLAHPNTSKTLVSDDLHQLTPHAVPDKKAFILRLFKSKLPAVYYADFIRMGLSTGDSLFAQKAIEIVNAFGGAGVSRSCMDRLVILLKLLSQHAKVEGMSRYSVLERVHAFASADERYQRAFMIFADAIERSTSENDNDNDNGAYVQAVLEELKKKPEKTMLVLLACGAKYCSDIPRVLKRKIHENENLFRGIFDYYKAEPSPSVTDLAKISAKIPADRPQESTAWIHHFETVLQATTQDGSSKRTYSVTNEDKENILRILGGLERKFESPIEKAERTSVLNLLYYLNTRAKVDKLSSLSLSELQSKIHENAGITRRANSVGRHDKAMLLACMREMLLRKTGKWANHTQVFALLYAAIHDKESLVHQVKTGEGKSIITIMRAAFLALSGYTVDVFSAKVSLSSRDHDEFKHVLDAFAIPHAYLNTESKQEDYKTNQQSKGVGAINYATVGNFNLYLAQHGWHNKPVILGDRTRRIAFLDEVDHMLLDERTQFNHTHQDSDAALYNLDAWVYRIVYQYYQDNTSLHDQEALSNIDLEPLCQALQAATKACSPTSAFLTEYLMPALAGNEIAIKARDEQLVQLMIAARKAHRLENGVHFTVRQEARVLNGQPMQTRFAKVLISNQVQEGSTYSDLVHQFLHARLNLEAAASGEVPNFFIEPVTRIALSSNVKAFFGPETPYEKIEGCTGTAGDANEVTYLKTMYGVKQVVALPKHLPSKSTLGMLSFCNDSVAHVTALVSYIADRQQPMLIACEDDRAVKRLAQAVVAELKSLNRQDRANQIIADTNDSHIKEKDILPLAGKNGAITFSARLGRGSDIKPDHEDGLSVVRTYIAGNDRIRDQEFGRQGRNGAKGKYGEIVDINRLMKIFEAQEENPDFQNIYRETQALVDIDLQGTTYAADTNAKTTYAKVRAAARYHHQQKLLTDVPTRQKDHIVAYYAAAISVMLKNPQLRDASSIQQQWLRCRHTIDTAWEHYLSQDAQSFTTFETAARTAWRSYFATPVPEVPAYTEQGSGAVARVSSAHAGTLARHRVEMQPILDVYCPFVRGIHEALPIFGARDKSTLIALFQVFQQMGDIPNYKPVLEALSDLKDDKRYRVSARGLTQGFTYILMGDLSEAQAKRLASVVREFYQLMDTLRERIDPVKWGHVFSAVMSVSRLYFKHNLDVDAVHLLKMVRHIVPVFIHHTHYWNRIKEGFAEAWLALFDHPSAALLLSCFDDVNAYEFIHLLSDIANKTFIARDENPANERRDYISRRAPVLHAYLADERNKQAIQADPRLLLPLLRLAFKQIAFGWRPTMQQVEKFSPDQRLSLLNFFADRVVTETEEQGHLIRWLLRQGKAQGLPDPAVFSSVMRMPPYVSSAYLLREVGSVGQGANTEATITRLNGIQRAATAFVRFLDTQHIVKNTTTYVESMDSAEYALWQSIFEPLAAQEAENLFCTMSEACGTIDNAVHSARFGNAFKQALDADVDMSNKTEKVQHIATLAKKHPRIAAFNQENFKALVDATSPQEVEAHLTGIDAVTAFDQRFQVAFYTLAATERPTKSMLDFMRIVSDYRGSQLSPLLIEHLWVQWGQYNAADQDPVQSLGDLLTSLTDRIKFFAKHNMRVDEYEQWVLSDRTVTFMQVMASYTSTALTDEQIQQLWAAWKKEVPLQTKAHLDAAIVLYRMSKEDKALASIHDGLHTAEDTASDQAARIFLMKSVTAECDVLCKEDFSNTCVDQYKRVLDKALGALNKKDHKANWFRSQDVSDFRRVLAIVAEVNAVAKPLQMSDIPGGRAGLNDKQQFITEYKRFFTEQKDCYAGMWFVNEARKKQADELFSGLARVNERAKPATICQQAIVKILKLQGQILSDDAKTTHNRSGKSRLFDITMVMLSRLLKDATALQLKEGCKNTMLLKNLREHLGMQVFNLLDRLRVEKHVGKSCFAELNEFYLTNVLTDCKSVSAWIEKACSSTILEDAVRLLNALPQSAQPRNLRHIFESIASMSVLLSSNNDWSNDAKPVEQLSQQRGYVVKAS